MRSFTILTLSSVRSRSPIDLTSLGFNFEIFGWCSFRECLDQDRDWDGMYSEGIRISEGKPIEVDLQIDTFMPKAKANHAEEE